MAIDRRVFELALENLENKRKKIDEEIAALRNQLKSSRAKGAPAADVEGRAVAKPKKLRP
ncbi:MAG: hypothetical protein FJW35_15255 [Acidobacteria bacterium]|nr:hypothetical protein [Acidobacteriota bacterium]